MTLSDPARLVGMRGDGFGVMNVATVHDSARGIMPSRLPSAAGAAHDAELHSARSRRVIDRARTVAMPLLQAAPPWHRQLAHVMNNALVGVLVVIAIQLWQLRGIVHARDLEMGDTASDYSRSLGWLHDGTLYLVQSPLYSMILGALHAVLGDAQVENTVVRVAAVLALDLLLLAFLRRFIAGDVALLVVAWWASLPLIYDSLYAVHILGLVLPFGALALAARDRQHRHTLWVLVLLVLGGVLMRPEFLIAAALYAVFLGARWLRSSVAGGVRAAVPGRGWSRSTAAVTLVIVVAGLAGMSADRDVGAVRQKVADRAVLNMCQHYANYIVQVDTRWQGNPWTECSAVLRRDFGRADVDFAAALQRNPAAVGHFVVWNLRGIPAALEMGLFDHYAATADPDFVPHAYARWAPAALAIAIALALMGLLVVFGTSFGRRTLRWRSNPDPIVVLVSLLALAGYIGLAFRPRPIWTVGFLLTLMFLIGVLVAFAFTTWPLAGRVRGFVVLGVLGLALLIPQHFNASYATHFSSVGQPLAHRYAALHSWLSADAQQPSRVRLFGVDMQMCRYLLWKGADCRAEAGGVDEFHKMTGIEPRHCPPDTWIGAVAFGPGRSSSMLQECVPR